MAQWLKQDEATGQTEEVRPDLNSITDEQWRDIFTISREPPDAAFGRLLVEYGGKSQKAILGGERGSMSTIERYLTRREVVRFLTEQGYPIGKSTIDKLSMPSRGDGPPPAGYWGNRALYDPNKVLAWAKARFRNNWRANGRKAA